MVSIWLDEGRANRRQVCSLTCAEEVAANFGPADVNRKGQSPGRAQPEMASRQTAPSVQSAIFGITVHTLRDRTQAATVLPRGKLYTESAFSGNPKAKPFPSNHGCISHLPTCLCGLRLGGIP